MENTSMVGTHLSGKEEMKARTQTLEAEIKHSIWGVLI